VGLSICSLIGSLQTESLAFQCPQLLYKLATAVSVLPAVLIDLQVLVTSSTYDFYYDVSNLLIRELDILKLLIHVLWSLEI